MKKLFLSVMALTIGAFAFVSCDNEDTVGKDEKSQLKDGYLTVDEQQALISSSLAGVAESVDFTEFSSAASVLSGILHKNYTDKTLYSILSDSDFAQDSILLGKLSKAATMFKGDSIFLDLSPLYLSADIYVIDTVFYDSVYAQSEGGSSFVRVDSLKTVLLDLKKVNHNNDCIDLNLYVDGHKIELIAKAKAAKKSILTVVNNRKEGVNELFLPESASVKVLLDGKNVLEMGGDIKSDLNILVEETGSDEEGTHISYDGSKISVKGNLSITGYRIDGSFNLDMEKGADFGLKLSIADNEAVSLSAKVEANFSDLNLSNDSLILKWAQDPEELKSISVKASIGGGKVSLKGSLDSPFKDQELAAGLKELMNPKASLTEEQSEALVAKLNEILNVELYFEDYKNPQAKLQLMYYNYAATDGNDVKDEGKDKSAFESILELFQKTNCYPVIVAHDKDGKEVTVSVIEYFSKIDLSFVDALSEKAQSAFGPIIEDLAPLFRQDDRKLK